MRVPDWVEGLETALRKQVSAVAARGNVTCSLRLTREDSEGMVEVNEVHLDSILAALHVIEHKAMDEGLSLAPSKATDIAGLRGVLEQNVAQDDTSALSALLLSAVAPVVQDFDAMRQSEGAQLAEVLHGQLEEVETLTRQAAELKDARAAESEAALQAAVLAAQDSYDKAADALSKARAKAAVRLDKAVSAELAPLKMERAVFATLIEADSDGPDGRDAVSFTVATNPGAPAGPLGKIASGGELSRFLLALKVCLTQGQDGLTLIFDEIDRGVGGATADAVGRRLAALAASGQVLVVTHSPQVAALGAHHWRVAKAVAKGMTTSTVIPLSAPERVDEVARMLSGDQITEEARKAAEVLLAG